MTNLACLVQPVIRYRMTDSVIMHDEICGCGLNTPWIDIDGRVDDILEFDHNDTTVRMPAVLFELCAKDIPGCDHCQVIQRAHDAIEMRVSVMPGYDRVETEQEILFSFRQLFESNGLGSIRIELVNKPLERTRSGKLRIAFKEFV
jgi:phenylacetate-coenzyme A ligase PaaK-like adenylate-forming protein